MTDAIPVITDTHCHLDLEQFNDDRDAIIERAKLNGVSRILVPALDLQSINQVLKTVEMDEILFAAIGIHPNSGRSWNKNTISQLTELANYKKVVAIGEIGLDYYWDDTPRYMQEAIFDHQLRLAERLNLPVVVHNREASGDVIRKLLDWQKGLVRSGSPLKDRPGVMHSYSAGKQAAKEAVQAGFYLGFTGPVTYKKADELRSIVAETPADRILIETDAPYLTPEPKRGHRNEPALVKNIIEKISELHDMPIEQMAKITTANAARLFEW